MIDFQRKVNGSCAQHFARRKYFCPAIVHGMSFEPYETIQKLYNTILRPPFPPLYELPSSNIPYWHCCQSMSHGNPASPIMPHSPGPLQIGCFTLAEALPTEVELMDPETFRVRLDSLGSRLNDALAFAKPLVEFPNEDDCAIIICQRAEEGCLALAHCSMARDQAKSLASLGPSKAALCKDTWQICQSWLQDATDAYAKCTQQFEVFRAAEGST